MSTPDDRRQRRRFGLRAEILAALWLRLFGWRIVARGFRGGGGEIDIAARRGRVLAIVEVKARQTEREAAFALSPRQRGRIVRAARALIAKNPALGRLDVRFDVILMRPGAIPRHIPAVFDETG